MEKRRLNFKNLFGIKNNTLPIILYDNDENINDKYKISLNSNYFARDKIHTMSVNSIKQFCNRNNLNPKLSDFQLIDLGLKNKFSNRKKKNIFVNKNFIKEKKYILAKQQTNNRSNNDNVLFIKWVTNAKVKLPSHDRRKRSSIKHIKNKDIHEPIVISKEDIKVNDKANVSEKAQLKNPQSKLTGCFKNTINVLSVPCGTPISPLKKKFFIENCVNGNQIKLSLPKINVEKNSLKKSKRRKIKFSSNNVLLNKRSKNINDIFDETLDLFCNPVHNSDISINGNLKESQINCQTETILDSKTFIDFREQNEFSKEMLNSIFGKKEICEEQDDTMDYKFQEWNKNIFFQLEKSNDNSNTNNYYTCKNEKFGNIQSQGVTNDDSLNTTFLIRRLNSLSVNNTTSKDKMFQKCNKALCFSKHEHFSNQYQKNFSLNISLVPKTIVKRSKGEELILNKKCENKTISPLVTDGQLLKEISSYELYNEVGFTKLYLYQKTPLHIHRADDFSRVYGLLPHETHIIAAFDGDVEMIKSFLENKEKNTRIYNYNRYFFQHVTQQNQFDKENLTNVYQDSVNDFDEKMEIDDC